MVSPRIAAHLTDAFQRLDHVLPAIREPRIAHRAVPRVGVHNGQDPQLLARRELVMHEIPRPHIVRTDCLLAIPAQLRFHTALRMLVPQLKPQLVVYATCLLHVDDPSFPTQQHVDAPIPIPHARLRDLLDPPFDGSLIGAPGLIVERRGIEPQGPTGPPDRYAPIEAHPANQLAHPSRLQSFRRITS